MADVKKLGDTLDWSGDRTLVDRLWALWDEGHSTAEIGRRMGTSKNAICGAARRFGLPARGSPLNGAPIDVSDEAKALARQLWAEGHSCASAPNRSADEEIICWSRMQSESGQDLAAILGRKETERRAGSGTFHWGVGNPPSLAVAGLHRAGIEPVVVFSVMKTRPKIIDTAPSVVVAWRRWMSVDGREQLLPPHSLVTSRGTAGKDVKARHYALVCRSDTPLILGDLGPFDPQVYRNIGGAGAPIGASQVTALLRRIGPDRHCDYRVNLRAFLTRDLWVRLCDPVVLCGSKLAAIGTVSAQTSAQEWKELVSWVRAGPTNVSSGHPYQPALL